MKKENRGGPRKGFGGPQPNSGRKPLKVPTERHVIRVTAPQWVEFQALDGSLWLQGQLNLKIKARLAAVEKSEAENG